MKLPLPVTPAAARRRRIALAALAARLRLGRYEVAAEDVAEAIVEFHTRR